MPEMLSLSNDPILFIAVMLGKILSVFVVLLLIVAYATYAERKIIGHMQTRLGPTMTGPLGLLQPIADGLKLFFKEDIIPSQASKVAFILAPMMILVPAFITVAVLPLGGDMIIGGYTVPLQITDLNVGILFILAMEGLGVYGIVLAGWASNNKYSLLGGIRAAAQVISYELAAGLSIVAVFMLAETLSLRGIVEAQSGSVFNWYIFSQPLAFCVFFITSVAEINRTPFDLPEAETELVSGFCTEYSSMKYALFFMAEYANMVVVAAVISTLFLGGPAGPFPGVINLLLKIFFFMFVLIWMRATLPRVRYDQLMFMGWKVFLPLALLNIVITAAVIIL
ncbi:MAG: NADH-quinone oxidoreductase subunit NuoH [Desulfuromonadaceae bacterium]|nr:NADH-quinone oxidoreductase subunit NuoH [Desulfuromonadaceae bacterium]